MSDSSVVLSERSGAKCEICESTTDLATHPLDDSGDADRSVWACAHCREQIEGEISDADHFRCLSGAIWSPVAAVQVLSYRLLHRLRDNGWARDLLEQAYLEDDVLAWAREPIDAAAQQVKVVDSNGTELHDGDSVTLIKDLDVKGANFTAKRGTMVKNIRLGDDPGLIEGRVNGTAIYLKTEFLKRA